MSASENKFDGQWHDIGACWNDGDVMVKYVRWAWKGTSIQGRMQYGHDATCQVCGATFKTSRKHAKTCGATCRKKLSRS